MKHPWQQPPLWDVRESLPICSGSLAGGRPVSHQRWDTVHFPSAPHLPFPLPVLPFPLHLQDFLLLFASSPGFQPCANSCQHRPYGEDSQEGFAFWRRDREKSSWLFPHATGSSAACQIHHQAVLHKNPEMGHFLSSGAPSKNLEYIGTPEPCPRHSTRDYFRTEHPATSPLRCQGCLRD